VVSQLSNRTLTSLIEQALYLSGKNDREFSPIEPDGNAVNAVAYLLQEILDQYRYEVPFYQELTVNTPEELKGLGIASVNYVKYFQGNASYPIKELNQKDFANFSAVKNITGPPSVYYFDRFNDAIDIYPVPTVNSNVNEFEVGYVPLDLITHLNQPIPSSWPLFAVKFFRYQLAKDICRLYKLNWLYEQDLQDAKQIMRDNGDNEMSIAKTPRWKRSQSVPPISWLWYLTGGPNV